MTSRFESQNAGFTLFETLISLGLLALVLAVSVAAIRPPSPALQLKAAAARLTNDASLARHTAIAENRPIIWTPDGLQCDEAAGAEFVFYPDGTVSGSDICLSPLNLRLHPLTGLLVGTKG